MQCIKRLNRYWRSGLALLMACGTVGDPSVVVADSQGVAPAEPTTVAAAAPSFELDVQPILTRLGCNAGACHGKARGQNGFALSLLAFDPDFDYEAITQHARGRRVFPAAPDYSLLLLKGAGLVSHGGGPLLKVGGDHYQTLHRWIAAGAPRRTPGEPKLVRVTVSPKQLSFEPGQSQPLQVTAHYSDGAARDVTHLAAYQSSESPLVQVDEQGRVTAGAIPGQAVIMARYMNLLDTFTATLPRTPTPPDAVYAKLPRANFIDDLVYAKLRSLGITPSEPVGDAKFMRRAFVDIIGRLPTPQQARQFIDDPSPDKRARLVDALLDRPEYADFWANKWADLLRPNPYRVGIKAVLNYDNWIRQSFRQNKPYDQFVTELITAQGSTWDNGAVTLFRDRRSPDEITTLVSQLFLGIRLECAKCHHHPFEKWSQADFYGFAAFFAQLKRKGRGLSPPISGSEEMVYHGGSGAVTHPVTGETLAPKPLFGQAPTVEGGGDPRQALAAWMTSPDNDYFAMAAANRVWAELMGRGLVDPVDDLRVTNPATNQPLLRALGDHLRDAGFDLKKLIRTIVLSDAYALSSLPNETNAADTRYHSRHYRTRLRAEVVLDAVSDITGVPESFAAMPANARAMQLWTHRVGSLTLDTFGRPDPNQDPPCERIEDPAVTQALHLMMGPPLHRKVVSDGAWPAKLAASERTPAQMVEELYLAVYNRYPTESERAYAAGLFTRDGTTRRQVAEDLLWAMINTPEFLFED